MHHRPLRHPLTAAIGAAASICLLSGCGAPAGPPDETGPTSTVSSTPAASAPSESASTDLPTVAATEVVPSVPLDTAVPSETPSAAASPTISTDRAISADGVFSVGIPAGATQDAGTIPDTVSAVTLDRTGNGNLVIVSLRYSKPQITATSWFSLERDTLKAAFPSCTFPIGADVIREKLGGKADANYRAFTCDAFPGTYTIFTANGPNGELLAGHDQDFTGGGQTWKALVLSAQTLKKP